MLGERFRAYLCIGTADQLTGEVGGGAFLASTGREHAVVSVRTAVYVDSLGPGPRRLLPAHPQRLWRRVATRPAFQRVQQILVNQLALYRNILG